MSAFPSLLPSIGAILPEAYAPGDNTSLNEGTSQTSAAAPSLLQDLQESIELNTPGLGPFFGMSQAIGGAGSGSLSSWFGARGVIMILGLMLIAAGLFAHSAVRETIVSAGKTAGKVAAVAA